MVMKHVHVRVFQLGSEVGVDFCMYNYGSWRVDKDITQSLVIGRKLSRVHIPLVTISHFGPRSGPRWCKVLPPPEEKLCWFDVDA